MNEKALIVIAILAVIVIDFALTSGVIAVVCWAFNLHFTWKIAIGVWLILVMVQGTFLGRKQ